MDVTTSQALGALILALLGLIGKYVNDLRLSQRADRLHRVNRRLKELYGPLLTLTYSCFSTWEEFIRKNRPEQTRNFHDNNYSEENDKTTWRIWITTVFQPINKSIYDIIITNGDLIIEDQFPQEFKEMRAHYKAYKPVIDNWQKGNFEEYVSLIDYPEKILAHAERSYDFLKNQQRKLLE